MKLQFDPCGNCHAEVLRSILPYHRSRLDPSEYLRMTSQWSRMRGSVLVLVLALTAMTRAADEAAYTADISKRADEIVKVLDLNDGAKAVRVRETIVAQYRGLRALDDAGKRDAAAVKELHEKFIAKLSEDLTAEQVDQVKDKLTYNVAQITYAAFCDMLPSLTDAQKAKIKQMLLEAREEAMDGGSSKEKHEIFGKYKGRINVYLSKEGYDLKKASKEWAERRKAAATRSA